MSSSHVHPVARRVARQAGADRVERGAGESQHILVFEFGERKSFKIDVLNVDVGAGGVTVYPESGEVYQYIYIDPIWTATVFWNTFANRKDCLWEPRGGD